MSRWEVVDRKLLYPNLKPEPAPPKRPRVDPQERVIRAMHKLEAELEVARLRDQKAGRRMR